jgi:hypothetical protein
MPARIASESGAANEKPSQERPHRAHGRLVRIATGDGVGGLIVEAHHVGSRGSHRLGSTTSNADGTFSIPFEAPASSAQNDARRADWNLQLQILAPERTGLSRRKRAAFTTEIRRHAGTREEFRIELTERKVASLNLVGDGVAGGYSARATRAAALGAEASGAETERLVEERLKEVQQRRSLLRGDLRNSVVEALTSVSETERMSGRFVPDEGEIGAKHDAAIVTDLADLTAGTAADANGVRAPKYQRRSRLVLTDAQRKALLRRRAGDSAFSEADLASVVGRGVAKPAAIFRAAVPDDPCRPMTDAERCFSNAPAGAAPGAGAVPAGPGGTQPAASVAMDEKAVIAQLFDRQATPEEPVEFGAAAALEPTLTAGGVDDVIRGVVFAPGPADVPAFHDFHDVQIAFEPVWQEALDRTFLDDVESVYDRVVESGGTPALKSVRDVLTAPGPDRRRRLHGVFDAIADVVAALDEDVPANVVASIFVGADEWKALPRSLRNELRELCNQIAELRTKLRDALDPDELEEIEIFGIADLIRASQSKKSISYRTQIQLLKADADRIVAHGRRLLLEQEAKMRWAPTHDIVERLRRHRGTSYPFRHFAASSTSRSVNFGLVVTYRQVWTPVSYQVGELASTIPLAPKEVRKFTTQTVTKSKRARQEVETNLTSRRREAEERSRAETEIVARAGAKTNFTLTSEGTFNVGSEQAFGGSAKTTSAFARDAEQHSQAVKKEFREAIIKSAEEFKNERKMEVTSEESFETEVTESGEISNPNDEIPVTFLFYELQRRYRVVEKLHRLQSVVFVAQEVPASNAIDAAWLIRHDWILNRSLLDDSFRAALTYVSTTLVSEDVALREMRDGLFRQRKLVEELKEDVAERRAMAGLRYAALQRQIERTAESAESGGGGLFGGVGDLVGGLGLGGELISGAIDLVTGGGDEGASQEAQIREGAARDAFDRERREEEERASRLMGAVSTLESMQQAYTERLGEHLRQLTQVERLAGHVAQNIMHYMQAIWSYEPDDQRFLRLRDVPVPVFQRDRRLRRFVLDRQPLARVSDLSLAGGRGFEVDVSPGILRPPGRPREIKTRPLSDVADLNRPLGFVGNYMVLPMYEANPITDFMMDPYVTLAEGEYGVSDPDVLGNMTLDDFTEYVCCLRKRREEEAAASGAAVPADPLAAERPVLQATLKRLLQLSLRDNDEIVVPTESLYIEALPGAHSVMERFKNLHRQIDVKAAQENLRRTQIDNLRRAQRVIDGDLEDPDIEGKYVFEGDGTAAVVSPPAAPGSPGGP